MKFSDGFPLSPGGLFQPADNRIYVTNATVRVQSPTDMGIPITENKANHTINSTHTAAVATDYYWIPIDENTPRGVKLQLLGQGGVAQYSNYHGDAFWSHWAPLPKRKD